VSVLGYSIKIYGSLNAYDEIISWIAEPMGGEEEFCLCRVILEESKLGSPHNVCFSYISLHPTPSSRLSSVFHNLT